VCVCVSGWDWRWAPCQGSDHIHQRQQAASGVDAGSYRGSGQAAAGGGGDGQRFKDSARMMSWGACCAWQRNSKQSVGRPGPFGGQRQRQGGSATKSRHAASAFRFCCHGVTAEGQCGCGARLSTFKRKKNFNTPWVMGAWVPCRPNELKPALPNSRTTDEQIQIDNEHSSAHGMGRVGPCCCFDLPCKKKGGTGPHKCSGSTSIDRTPYHELSEPFDALAFRVRSRGKGRTKRQTAEAEPPQKTR